MGTIVGFALIGVSLFMLLGFFTADISASASTMVLSLLVAVGVPGTAGAYLLRKQWGGGRKLATRRDELKRQTQEAEVIRMAVEHGGRLTVIELVRDLAMSQPEAEGLLRSMVERGLADIEVTDAGLLVYTFPDVQRLSDKSTSRGVLDD